MSLIASPRPSSLFAVEGAKEGMVDPLVGPFFGWLEMIIDLFHQL
jgi:hypothetical protein